MGRLWSSDVEWRSVSHSPPMGGFHDILVSAIGPLHFSESSIQLTLQKPQGTTSDEQAQLEMNFKTDVFLVMNGK